MYAIRNVVDGKYRISRLCSDSGGMGTLVHVDPIDGSNAYPLVLKYCKSQDQSVIKRFRREIRLLSVFSSNSRIVQVLDRNIDVTPPYYVMKFYVDGDLTSLSPRLHTELELQEVVFCQMVDCIAELHARNVFHRDIKPQNFLRDGGEVVVSDFGLSMEAESRTAFTSTTEAWGTQGYLPPEFQNGGFRNATAASDVFMLGKSFFALLTGQLHPIYLSQGHIPAPVFRVIQKCCCVEPSRRYQVLAELRTALVAAYDMLLRRTRDVTTARSLLWQISGALTGTGSGLDSILDSPMPEDGDESEKLNTFLDELGSLAESDQVRLCAEIGVRVFRSICRSPVHERLPELLDIYRVMVEKADYGWAFAETIAGNMAVLFDHPHVSPDAKANALDLAIIASVRMNRFAAMDRCVDIIKTIEDNDTALAVRELFSKYVDTFVSKIRPEECRNALIREALVHTSGTSGIAN